MKIFITGGTGQVGFELQRSLSVFGEIIAPTRLALDLMDLGAVEQFLNVHQPDVIVNAAAWTAVDLAEQEHEGAYCLNAELPKFLASYAATKNIWLVHYSSDYVYPGTGTGFWVEDDATSPLSIYGKSKLAGDEAIMASGAQYLIFRTSWVYGARGNNFMKTMLRLGAQRENLNVVSDQIGAPTPSRLISYVTAMSIDRILSGAGVEKGIYHLAPKGSTNWCDFAKEIFQLAEHAGIALKVSQSNVGAIKTVDYPTPATRPLNSRINVEKLEKVLSITLPSWKDQLKLTLDEYVGTQGIN
jgi:dTDP-4-dehydrorhamnose reductase